MRTQDGNILVGAMASPERVAAIAAARDRVWPALNGIEATAALDGLISVWLALSLEVCGLKGTRRAARELADSVERLASLDDTQGSA